MNVDYVKIWRIICEEQAKRGETLKDMPVITWSVLREIIAEHDRVKALCLESIANQQDLAMKHEDIKEAYLSLLERSALQKALFIVLLRRVDAFFDDKSQNLFGQKHPIGEDAHNMLSSLQERPSNAGSKVEICDDCSGKGCEKCCNGSRNAPEPRKHVREGWDG